MILKDLFIKSLLMDSYESHPFKLGDSVMTLLIEVYL